MPFKQRGFTFCWPARTTSSAPCKSHMTKSHDAHGHDREDTGGVRGGRGGGVGVQSGWVGRGAWGKHTKHLEMMKTCQQNNTKQMEMLRKYMENKAKIKKYVNN